jgi:hypothetical protein
MKALSSKVPDQQNYRVADARRNEDVLLLQGDGWSFSSDCEWRITRNGTIVSSSQNYVQAVLDELLGKQIIQIVPQSQEVPIDPCIRFEGDLVLEVFSTDNFEPWVFTTLDGQVFVGMT